LSTGRASLRGPSAPGASLGTKRDGQTVKLKRFNPGGDKLAGQTLPVGEGAAIEQPLTDALIQRAGRTDLGCAAEAGHDAAPQLLRGDSGVSCHLILITRLAEQLIQDRGVAVI
jgi:hypothetical protein